MNDDYALYRFIEAQERNYKVALSEITAGQKQSHWMWYIFPQLRGLGLSSTSEFYGIISKEEAIAYLNHPILGARLIEITNATLNIEGKTAKEIFGSPDDKKFKSCMSLFHFVSENKSPFSKALAKYFDGNSCWKTKKLLNEMTNL